MTSVGRPEGPPTIRDVAALSKVSIATVSRVINDSGRVAAGTQERVRDAIAQLGFVSSPNARVMRPGVRSLTWGLLIDELSSGYYGLVVHELDHAAEIHDSTLLVSTTQKRLQREIQLIRTMASRRVDGLFVIAANGDHSTLGPLPPSLPLVYLDRIPYGRPADVVTFDYYQAMRAQVERLWGLGHRRLGYLGGEAGEDPGSRRFAAFRDTVLAAGGSIDPALVSLDHHDASTSAPAALAMSRQDDPPTALVCTTGPITLGVLRVVLEHGLVVEVASGEDFEGGFLSPVPLHVIQADLQLLAREGTALLLDRIGGSGATPIGPVTRMLTVNEFHHGPPSRSLL